MSDRKKLKLKINEDLAKYELDISSVVKRINPIYRWLEENCSSMELWVDNPYLDIANRAVEHAVNAADDFIHKELREKNLEYDDLEQTWKSVLDSFDMKGLNEEEYIGVITDRPILGESDNNFSINEVLNEDDINSMYVDTPKKSYSLADQLLTTNIFRLLEKKRPSKKKNEYKGHDISMKDKVRTTILVLKYFGISKSFPGVTSAEKDIEIKEEKYPEFAKLKKDIDSIK
jgi:hypothetical protein